MSNQDHEAKPKPRLQWYKYRKQFNTQDNTKWTALTQVHKQQAAVCKCIHKEATKVKDQVKHVHVYENQSQQQIQVVQDNSNNENQIIVQHGQNQGNRDQAMNNRMHPDDKVLNASEDHKGNEPVTTKWLKQQHEYRINQVQGRPTAECKEVRAQN